MRIVSDLHLHGRYSRACSKDLSIANLEKYARLKGIGLLGTADFTHPIWIKELRNNLKEDSDGILRTKTGFPFIWTTEISLMYSQGGKGRKVHHCVFAPSGDVVQQITDELGKKGRLDYDGRPIFGISSIEFVEMLRGISHDIEVIPAHAWTPWFGILGSKSGFDSIKDCFLDQTKHIHAIETGLSSDPEMNWRVSELDKYQLISNSDSHSFWPWRLGREATVFDFKNLSYNNLLKAVRSGDGLTETIEVDPNYGKYHFDGHRNCNINFGPSETRKLKGVCPRCKKQMTIGVLSRVEELADRPEGYKPKNAKPYRTLLPLAELISYSLGKGLASKKVISGVFDMINKFGNEMKILLEVPLDELKEKVDDSLGVKIVDTIIKNREGKIVVKPGYDGLYGYQEGGIPPKVPPPEVKKLKKSSVKSKKPVIQKGLDEF